MDVFMIFLVIVVVVALFRFINPNKKSGHPGDQPGANETGLMWFPGNDGSESGGDSRGDGGGDSFDGGSADGGGGDSSSF